MSVRIGFLGFGEAAAAIARGLRGEGVVGIAAYDLLEMAPAHRKRLLERATAAGTTLCDSAAEVVETSDVVFSAVTASAALEVASDASPYLRPDQLYVDINSASPGVKQQVQTEVERGGAVFVEAAVMAAVPPHEHRVPMLLAGRGAQRFAAIMTPLGMCLEVLGEEVGRASAIKMFRSIMTKGIEALLLECLLASGRYGVESRVLQSLSESMPGLDWARHADYLLGRTVLHGPRRAHEMEEVSATLCEFGVEPIMAAAAARRLAWAGELGLQAHFPEGGPSSFREVLLAIQEVVPS